MIGAFQHESLVDIINEVIEIKYDGKENVQSNETLTGLILARKGKIEEILEITLESR
jgi:hypothetical protein